MIGDGCRMLWAVESLPGYPGFLGTRGSLMLDIVVVAMVAVIPAMAVSWYLVRKRRAYGVHKKLQLVLATVLLATVALFELEVRIHGWQARAAASPYWRDGAANDLIDGSLAVHLACAVPTFFLWLAVVLRAWRGFPAPPVPGAHSAWHRRWGYLAMLGMTMTAVTGWIFYYLAFTAQ